jgi:hypothetical protein
MDSLQIYADTMPAEQLMAMPVSLAKQGANISLNWPALNSGLVLQSATAMVPQSGWAPVINTPSTTNGVQFLSLPIAPGTRLFRLQWPLVAN